MSRLLEVPAQEISGGIACTPSRVGRRRADCYVPLKNPASCISAGDDNSLSGDFLGMEPVFWAGGDRPLSHLSMHLSRIDFI